MRLPGPLCSQTFGQSHHSCLTDIIRDLRLRKINSMRTYTRREDHTSPSSLALSFLHLGILITLHDLGSSLSAQKAPRCIDIESSPPLLGCHGQSVGTSHHSCKIEQDIQAAHVLGSNGERGRHGCRVCHVYWIGMYFRGDKVRLQARDGSGRGG